jgi:hypothetical protein
MMRLALSKDFGGSSAHRPGAARPVPRLDEAQRADRGGTRRLYQLIREHGPAVEASLAFHGIDLRDWYLPAAGRHGSPRAY